MSLDSGFAAIAAPRNDNTPHTAFAISRSLNFWILPVLVFGISANTT
jgi:hypothetical protein